MINDSNHNTDAIDTTPHSKPTLIHASNHNTDEINTFIATKFGGQHFAIKQAKNGRLIDVPIADNSRKTYERIAKRMAATKDIAAYLSQPRSPGSLGALKAGIKHRIATLTIEAASCLDIRPDGTAQLKPAPIAKIIGHRQDGSAIFDFPPEAPDFKALTREIDRLTAGMRNMKPAEVKVRRQSLREQNRLLLDGWYDKLVGRIKDTPDDYRIHALVSLLAGVRPHEFTAGTAANPLGIKVYFDDNTVSIEIEGAKQKLDKSNQKQLTGMPWRKITFNLPTDDEGINLLLAQRPTDGTKVLELPPITELGKKGLARYLGKIGVGLIKEKVKKVDGKKVKVTPQLSAYNLRHAFATRLKQSKMSDIDVSRCLGHISMKTKSYYGRSNTKSGGGLAPDKVTSKLKPRENVSQHPAVKARPVKATQAVPAQTTPAQAKPKPRGMKP